MAEQINQNLSSNPKDKVSEEGQEEQAEILDSIDYKNLTIDHFLDLPEELYEEIIDRWIAYKFRLNYEYDEYNVQDYDFIAEKFIRNLKKFKTKKQQEIVLEILLKSSVQVDLINYLPEISDYFNKKELVLRIVRSSPIAGREILKHLSEISDYSNIKDIILQVACKREFYLSNDIFDYLPDISNFSEKEEIVLKLVQYNELYALRIINHLLEILDYSNKDEIVLMALDKNPSVGEALMSEEHFEVISNYFDRERILLRAVKTSSYAAQTLIYDYLPKISNYSNKEKIVLEAVSRNSNAATNLLDHLPEISDYSNKKEIFLALIEEGNGLGHIIFDYLSDISKFTEREEIVLMIVQLDFAASLKMVDLLEEISDYSNKEEIEFTARLIAFKNPDFELGNKESLVLKVIESSELAAGRITKHLPEISDYSNREEVVLKSIRYSNDENVPFELIGSHLSEILNYSNKEEILKLCFELLDVSYDSKKISYIFDHIKEIEENLSKKERWEYFELSDYEVNFKSPRAILEFRAYNLWQENEKKQYLLIRNYLESQKENYQQWLEEKIDQMSSEEQQVFFGQTGLPREFNSVDILLNYLKTENYHMALDCWNEYNFEKLEVQDLIQLLNTAIPRANPNDFGKDKYEIFKSFLDDYGSPNFIDNFLSKYSNEKDVAELGDELTDKMRAVPKVVRRKPSIEERELIEKKRNQLTSQIFREKNLFSNLLALYKETRILASFTENDYEKLSQFKKEGKDKVYSYFLYLLDHDTASFDALRSLLSKPSKFFDQGCSYDELGVSSEINPNNWHEVAYYGEDKIDLTSEDIRNIFMDGRLDSIIPIKPLRKDYPAELTPESKKEILKRNREKISQMEKDLAEYYQQESQTGGDLKKKEKLEMESEVQKIIAKTIFEKKSLLEFFEKADKQIRKALNSVSEEREKEYENIIDSGNGQEIIDFVLDNLNVTSNYLQKNGVQFKNDLEDKESLEELIATKNVQIFTAKAIKYLQKQNHPEIEKIQQKIQQRYKTSFSDQIVLRAEILPPSNPERPTVGNNTNSCDGFGDGKRTQYDFNPTCSQFAISFVEKLPNGREKINVVAQSLITLDSNIEDGDKIQELLRGFDNLGKILGEDFLEKYYKNPKTIAFDNIEVNNNFKGKITFKERTVGAIYKDFAKELLKQNPQFNQGSFLVGTTCNDLNVINDLQAQSSPNSFLISTILPYTDKTEEECNLVKTGLKNKTESKEFKTGVQSISALDTFPVAYLEEKVYNETGAEDLVEGVIDIQNVLIGSSYSALKNNIPNLNKGYFDKGVLRGYILSYPIINKEGELSIYICDLVADPKSKLAGGKLMLSFLNDVKPILEKIKQQTGQEKVTLISDAREETAYPILKKSAERHGFEILEDSDEEDGMRRLEMAIMAK
jgi:hypothetical protein